MVTAPEPDPLEWDARAFDREAAARALAPLVADALRSLSDEQLRALLRRRAERRAREPRLISDKQ